MSHLDSRRLDLLFAVFSPTHQLSAYRVCSFPLSPLILIQLTVPAPLVALMSAHRVAEQTVTDAAAGTVTYAFRQPVCMPSYLLAFAVGALESRQIGPRSVVWSEKVRMSACV